MKKRSAMLVCVACLALMSTGCLEALVSNPDAAQAFITQRVDMVLGAVVDWTLYLDGLVARIPVL
ncbi:MAG: hypothetical protein O7D91_17705 [Planctomycetota bacterium]|nr:hypothetical protein [Planctomycetota bacterium]